MVFGTTLGGLATRNTAGSGLGAYCPGRCRALQTTEKTTVGGVYKAPSDPLLLEGPFPLARLVCHVLLLFRNPPILYL